MAKWKHNNIYIYFNDIFGTLGENCLPYMPESFTCNVNGRNEEIDILHGIRENESLAGTMNFIKRPGLKTWSIECFFNHPEKPMYEEVSKSSKWTPQFWVDFFESAMYERKVLEMTVTGLDIVCYVTVESFKHTKEAGEELDTYYTIEIKEYQFNEIEESEINIVQEMPKYDGKNTNQQPTKPNMGEKAWFIGVPYKQLVGVELKYPYTWIFTNGSKNLEGLTYLDYMPVKVIERVTKTKITPIISGLGEFLIEKAKSLGKSYSPQNFFPVVLRIAWEDRDDLHNWFNNKGHSQEDFRRNGTLLYENFREYCKNAYADANTGEGILTTIVYGVWDKYFTNGNKTNWTNYFKSHNEQHWGDYTYWFNANIKIEYCQCETQQEFGVNQGSASAFIGPRKNDNFLTGVEYCPKGTKIWGFAKQQTNNPITSYVTNENRGNIPFTIKGVNKDMSEHRQTDFK